MPRPPQTNPPRARATGGSFAKEPQFLEIDVPSPYTDAPASPVSGHQVQTGPTPPYSSTEDFGIYQAPSQPYPQSYLMLPPSLSPRHSAAPAQQLSSPSPVGPPSAGTSPQQYTPTDHYDGHSYAYSMGPHLQQSYSYGDLDQYLVQDTSAGSSAPNTHPGGEADFGHYVDYSSQVALQASSDLENTPKAGPPVHTPRPPNAWILYRSDKLKAIAAGDEIPGLDGVMAELGVSGSSSSDEIEKDAGDKETDDTAEKAKPKPKKKGKKGVKEPTEGLLSLGRGKTGRGLPQADISKMISMLWKRESAVIRGEYERRSEVKKAEHAAMYPGYKFKPLRKADKIKIREEKEREKEAMRREKELQRSGGRRRQRTRARLSPTTPYSVTTADGARAMARSLTYSGGGSAADGTHESFAAGESFYRHFDRSNLTPGHASGHSTPGETFDDQRHRSYPFPMPQSSLPSMRRDELGIPNDDVPHNFPPPPVLETTTFRPHTGNLHTDTSTTTPRPVTAPAQSSRYTFIDDSPAKATRSARQDLNVATGSHLPAPPPHNQPTTGVNDMAPMSTYSVRDAYGQMANKTMDQIDAHDLVSLWCANEDDPLAPTTSWSDTADLDQSTSVSLASGRKDPIFTEPRVVQDAHLHQATGPYQDPNVQGGHWSTTYDQQHTFAEVELRSIPPPMYPAGWIQVPAPSHQVRASPHDPQTQFIAPEGALVVNGNAYAYAPAVSTDGIVNLPIFYASDMSMMPNATASWNEDFYLQFPDLGDESYMLGDNTNAPLIPMEAMVVEDQGPFLNEQAVLSPPVADWTLRAAPTNANTPAPSPADDSNPALGSYNYIPRHISTSSFSLTPHTSNGSLAGNTSWTDRSASFAFANAFQGSLDGGLGEDLFNWEEEDSSTPASSNQPRSRIASRNSADGNLNSCGKRSRSAAIKFGDEHTSVG